MHRDADKPVETVWAGRFIRTMVQGQWEYVGRARGIGAAVILAIDDADRVVLVEQYRVPLGQRCLEMPAGLVGDEDADEPLLDAANRELEEETGYRARAVESIGLFHSSPGMVTEGFTLVRATGLEKVGPGGGHDDERIEVHLVPRAEIPAFVAAKRAAGIAIDVKMLLLLADSLLSPQATRPG